MKHTHRTIIYLLLFLMIGVGGFLFQAKVSAAVTGTKNVVVLRVYFQDYAANSRYTKLQVEGFFGNLDALWKNTSYNHINIKAQVSTLSQLIDNRSLYIDDLPLCEPDPAKRPNGDLSCGGKYQKVLDDAVASAPAGLDWTNVDAVMVVMAETDVTQFHRGQGNQCTVAMGPGGDRKEVGCTVLSENPSKTDLQNWGRWAHEMGHAFQVGGPAHPSNYNNNFELMDASYPGQTGVFEKQSNTGFPGWLPTTKYQTFTPPGGGGTANIWAEEYLPAGKPNIQAVKVVITDNLYYLVSVRRRVLGDELRGIPDEGVLIERVIEGANPWVTVKFPPGTNRDTLWKVSSPTFDGGADGVVIRVVQKLDATGDNYQVLVRYNKNAFQPDVALEPWTSPPGNTYETTDIWVDSPINGYGTYRYGFWNDLKGNPVPRGNGDDPGIHQVNRLYARVRNIGESAATNVVVNWEITNPPGVGIAGANGWAVLGSVDKTSFPTLASIPAGGYVDVYMNWTPNFPISTADLAAGRFNFHTCLRVKLNNVVGEMVFANQDGDREQENIDYFQAPPPQTTASVYQDVIRLHNDDLVNKKFFYLSYKDDLPPLWAVRVNNGVMGVQLNPGEVRNIPITIKPKGTATVGSIYGLDVKASSFKSLVNNMDAKDLHSEYKRLGGVRIETRVMVPPKISCVAEDSGKNTTTVRGKLSMPNFSLYYDPKNPFVVGLEGVDGSRSFMPSTLQVVQVGPDGTFSGVLNSAATKAGTPKEAACLFAGTTKVSSASSGYLPILPVRSQQTDLTTTFTVITVKPTAGISLLVNGAVNNAGPGSSTATPLRYLLSVDPIITAQDQQISGVAVPSLAAGKSFVDNKRALPAFNKPGQYYLGTCVTAINSETNVLNNCSKSVLVTVGSKKRTTGDFNGDGKGDILWRHSNGTTVMWQMNGSTMQSGKSLGVVPPGWRIVGMGDFNGDGKEDILWHHSKGTTVLWLMNGSTILSSQSLGIVPTSWSIVGAADFDGDGKGDILWRHSSGVTVLWLMNGSTVLSRTSLGMIPTSWSVVDTADFNGDGKADILWRHRSGIAVMWLMNGATMLSGKSLGMVPVSWNIAGTADFNGDGKDDILWRHSSGVTVLWLMNGTTVLSGHSLGVVPTSWSIIDTADFNGDGKSDILWRHSSGVMAMWMMNGATVQSRGSPGSVPTQWSVQQ